MASAKKPKIAVSREKIAGEGFKLANEKQREIGMLIKGSDEALHKAFNYLGSIAVHYYSSEAIHHPCFAVQTETLAGVPEPLVQQGLNEAREQAIVFFGRKEFRPKGNV